MWVGRRRPALSVSIGAILLTLVAVSAAPTISSCYSSNYQREITANVALISDLADKLADYSSAGFVLGGRQVSSEEMGEFYYALKKARATAAMTAAQSSQPSHRDFERMLDAYTVLVRAADEYRLAGAADPARRAAILAARDQVKRLAREVTGDLAREAR